MRKYPNQDPETNIVFKIPFHTITARRYFSPRSMSMQVIVAVEKTDIPGLELWFSPAQVEALIAALVKANAEARRLEAMSAVPDAGDAAAPGDGGSE